MNDPMLPVPFRVTRVRRESSDVVSVTLDAEPRGGFGFLPGQFNMLYAFGVGEAAISISGSAAKPQQLVHTIRSVGSVTRALCGAKRGDSVGVRGPFGSAWPLQAAHGKDVLVVAGGIGLAPLRPIVYEVLRQPKRYGKLTLLYGTRSPADIAFKPELERWRRRGVRVSVTVDHGEPSWSGETGVVTALLGRAALDPRKSVAFLCGPEVMMRFALRELARLGFEREQLFLTLERSMRCGIGHCGHCQLGPHFLCKDGPVYRFDRIAPFFALGEY